MAEKAPIAFADGAHIDIRNSHLTAGFLAGAVIFSSGERQSGSELNLTNSCLSVRTEDGAGLWFGNVIATANLVSTQINIAPGILVVANYSQVTQDFNYFANSTGAAEATIMVSESNLNGDLVAYNGSSINWSLSNHSTWTCTAYSAYRESSFSVSLDATSSWTMTSDTILTNFSNADKSMSNVYSEGFNLYYDSHSISNRWLAGTTKKMHGGGHLKPASQHLHSSHHTH